MIEQLGSKQHVKNATKNSRMEKWKNMIQYGLDAKSAQKVFLSKTKAIDPFETI